MKLRYRKTKHKNIYLALIAFKHNLRTYFRIVALKFITYFAQIPFISASANAPMYAKRNL